MDMTVTAMSRTARVVVPSALRSDGSKPRCQPAGPLKGKRVGLRRDKFWVSWDVITDEWAILLQQDGATVVMWRAPIAKGDDAAAASGAEYAEFLSSIDVAVVGLCNCGSCSMWAVHDAVGALERGMPTVVVATQQFEPLVRTLAKQRGHNELRLALLPYPLEGQDDAYLREVAREHYAELLETVGAVRS
jgi:hypothetical protein